MRTATDSVERLQALFAAIAREPWAWSFYQVLRRIDCLCQDSPRIGTADLPRHEAIRLGQEPALSFAPASLSSFVSAEKGLPPRLEVRFFGLFGPNGPLPLYLTEYALGRMRHHNDPTLARFADLIHHRFLSLFYRAWAQAQPCVSLDRPAEDRFGAYLGSLAGIGLPAWRDRDALPDFAKLHHAALFNRQVRNAEGLAMLVAGFFCLPVAVEQFVGHWMKIPRHDRTRLGVARHCLGRSAVVGRRVWDRQHKFRLRVGPMGLQRYVGLLPGGQAIAELEACVRNYAGLEYAWDAQLLLHAAEVPALKLDGACRLGYTTWLGKRGSDAPADDLVLDVEMALQRHRSLTAATNRRSSNY